MVTRTGGITDAVLMALRKSANQETHINDIMADTSLTKAQVQGAVSSLRNAHGMNISIPRRGWYVFHPGGAPTTVTVKAKAEVQALLEDGRVLVVIEGKLFVAKELEIK